MATNLENTTTNAIISSTPPNINEAKKTPFWTRKLIKLKRQLKASRKSYKAAGDHRLRQTRLEKYRQIKQQYEKEVYNSKKKTWSKFVEENLSTDVWGMPYKIVMNKIKTKGVFNTLKREDGSYTKTWKETMEILFTKLFPDDNIDEDNEENQIVRNEVRYIQDTNIDLNPPMITNDEVAAAIKSIKTKKAPGPDGIKGEIYKNSMEIWTPYLTRLYNECLRQGKFPKPWKIANLVVLLKGDDKPRSNPKSYRPICLLNIISKIFEKVLA